MRAAVCWNMFGKVFVMMPKMRTWVQRVASASTSADDIPNNMDISREFADELSLHEAW